MKTDTDGGGHRHMYIQVLEDSAVWAYRALHSSWVHSIHRNNSALIVTTCQYAVSFYCSEKLRHEIAHQLTLEAHHCVWPHAKVNHSLVGQRTENTPAFGSLWKSWLSAAKTSPWGCTGSYFGSSKCFFATLKTRKLFPNGIYELLLSPKMAIKSTSYQRQEFMFILSVRTRGRRSRWDPVWTLSVGENWLMPMLIHGDYTQEVFS